jgi:hypothetical protein
MLFGSSFTQESLSLLCTAHRSARKAMDTRPLPLSAYGPVPASNVGFNSLSEVELSSRVMVCLSWVYDAVRWFVR